jgi:hypothetical protein
MEFVRNASQPLCFFSDIKGLQAPIQASNGALLLNIYKDGKWVPEISMMAIEVYVCQNCGYLEFYAHEADEPEKLTDSSNWRKVK